MIWEMADCLAERINSIRGPMASYPIILLVLYLLTLTHPAWTLPAPMSLTVLLSVSFSWPVRFSCSDFFVLVQGV